MSLSALLVEVDVLEERLRDISQHRALVLAAVEAGKPGAQSELVQSLCSERALRTLSARLVERVMRATTEVCDG